MKVGDKVRLKLTGEEVMILKIVPAPVRTFTTTPLTGPGNSLVRVRLQDMRILDVYEVEIEAIEPETGHEEGSDKILLMENEAGAE